MKTLRFIFPLLLLLCMAGCRSAKQPAPEIEPEGGEEPTWTNVTMPVKVSISEPVHFTMNGTATMVRNEYVLVTFRYFGFDVASLCLTPESIDMVVKMPQKAWLHEPIGDRLTKRGLQFSTLQEAMLGNRSVLKLLPESIDVTPGGSETSPEITVRTTVRGRKIEVSLSYNLEAAKWNRQNPPHFTAPGSDYTKMTLESAVKLLGR